MKRANLSIPAAAALLLAGMAARAAPPEIVDTRGDSLGGAWSIAVTLRHPDTGWDHYADGWEVLAPDGRRLGYRALAHPHVDEQPFTRSLSGLAIPPGTPFVLIRAHCNVTGWNGQTARLPLHE